MRKMTMLIPNACFSPLLLPSSCRDKKTDAPRVVLPNSSESPYTNKITTRRQRRSNRYRNRCLMLPIALFFILFYGVLFFFHNLITPVVSGFFLEVVPLRYQGFTSIPAAQQSTGNRKRMPYRQQQRSQITVTNFPSALPFAVAQSDENVDASIEGSSSSISYLSRRLKNESYGGIWADRLSVTSFNMDLNNLAMEDPQMAQDALEIMEELHAQFPENIGTVQPDSACYTTVLEGWLDAGNVEAAQALLDRMEQMEDEARRSGTLDPIVAPTSLTYMLMIQAWANQVDNDFECTSAEKAEALMRHMEHRGSVDPDVRIWSVVLDGWCKRASLSRNAIKRANQLLQEMENSMKSTTRQNIKKHETTSHNMETNGTCFVPPPPNVVTYTNFLGGLARSRVGNLASQAEGVLERMELHGVEADMVAYTSVLNCWSKAVSRREREVAATRALKILTRMERLYAQEKYHVKPSLITYSTAIRAIANSIDPNAPQIAESVLQRMYNLHKSGLIANIKPTTSIYNSVIYAFGCAKDPTSRLKYAKRAEDLLNEMTKRASDGGEKDVQPDVRTWAAVLRAWAQSRQPDAAENAQRVLDKLENLYARGETTVRPNFVCYTTVMGAWGNSRRKDALDKMERILKRMEQKYEETLEANVRPNTVSYVTAIDAFVRRNENDAAQRAQATVDRMIRLFKKGLGHVRPTKIVFNTLIHAWSKSSDRDAPRQAENVFKWMESQWIAGDTQLRPDEVSLCAVLNAWANQASDVGAQRAQQIWEHMESLTLEERGFALSITAPNIVIKAIARSRDPEAAHKAESILIRLEDEYGYGKGMLRPDVTTYSSVINACAYCSGDFDARSKALDIAFRTFKKLRQSDEEKPNNITFGTLFKAIANLMPLTSDERDNIVRQLFDECCETGNVDGFVLSQLRHASRQVYQELVEEPCGLAGPQADTSVSSVLRNIPSEWCANVVE